MVSSSTTCWMSGMNPKVAWATIAMITPMRMAALFRRVRSGLSSLSVPAAYDFVLSACVPVSVGSSARAPSEIVMIQ